MTTLATSLVLGLALALLIIVAAGAVWLLRWRLDIRRKGLPGPWRGLRELVQDEDRLLSEAVFERALQIYLNRYMGRESTLALLTQEYLREEFLLVVDEQGRASGAAGAMLARFRETAAANPAFAKWFREDALPGQPVLLAARWLCHLAGLRHGTVEIFIDPPGLPDHTLVQVRGLSKFEAPGAFDIPCAGHISGVDSADESLRKELGEELNLSLDYLDDLRLIKRYNSYTGKNFNGTINNEHRVLYQASLKQRAVSRIRFTDGEVAGLAVFSVGELRELVRRYPERIASGLGDAMGYYEAPERHID